MFEGTALIYTNSRTNRILWMGQSICWLVYAVAAFLLIVNHSTSHPSALFALKIWRSSLGLLASMAIFCIVHQIPRRAAKVWPISTAAIASIILGYLWFIAFRLSANPLRGLPLANWSFLRDSRDSIEQIALLLVCSSVYIAGRIWRDALDEQQRAGEALSNIERLTEDIRNLETRIAQQSTSRRQRDFIVLNCGRNLRVLKINFIVRIKAAGDYSEVLTIANENIFAVMSLKQWTERLAHHPFARVHRSTIVNLDHVEKIERSQLNGATLHLKSNLGAIKVSRRKFTGLKLL